MRSFKNTLEKTHSFQRPLLSCRPYDKCFSLLLNHWLGLEPIYEMIILKSFLQALTRPDMRRRRTMSRKRQEMAWKNICPIEFAAPMIKPRGKNSHQVNRPNNDYPSSNLKASKKELGPWKAIVDAQLWNLTKGQLILSIDEAGYIFWPILSAPLLR